MGEPTRLERLEAMLGESPQDRDLRYFLATEYFQAGRLAEALRELDRYFESGDDEGVGYKMRGTCLYRLGRKEEARACLEAGIEAARRHRHADLADDIEEVLEQFFTGG